ncbi:MAG: TetR-like C-terminal domain-containing protein [Roseiarcus sp.]|jgi:AcrR family transcriptional regulator
MIVVKRQETSGRRVALREALLAAAERVIRARGHQALRARELALDVGCALGAIYNVFPDLDALILAVKARTLDFLDAEIAGRIMTAAGSEGADPGLAQREAERLLQELARLYLAFASENPRLWQAVFEHRSPNADVPDSYMEKLERVLGYVERPLAILSPAASDGERTALAQALFSAVHGIVALGLDGKLGPVSPELLQWQVGALVHAVAIGLAADPGLTGAGR